MAHSPQHLVSRASRVPRIRDLNQRLSRFEQPPRIWDRTLENLAQRPGRGISAGDPENLRRRTAPTHHLKEIPVLCHHRRAGDLGSLEDVCVLRISEPQVAKRFDINTVVNSKPCGYGRLEMGVKPEFHAAKTGWSSRRLAYRRQAEMSSFSRSGSSLSTSCLDRPAARRSRTSTTRIRMPRTQGRPPHCLGFTVIRSSISPMSTPGLLMIHLCPRVYLQPTTIS